MKVAVYIDGFNFYHAVAALNRPEIKWLNLRKLAESFCGVGDKLEIVRYFSALSTWNKDKRARHLEYIHALEAVGITVHLGHFQKTKKICDETGRHCVFREEKHTDVAIAISMLGDAHAAIFDKAVLITADSDQVPTVRYIRENFPDRHVLVAAPPNRLSNARDLGAVASERREITEGRLRTCLFARNVVDHRGKIVARCPAEYIPD